MVGVTEEIIIARLAIVITRVITPEENTPTIDIVQVTVAIVVVAVEVTLVISAEIITAIKLVTGFTVKDISRARIISRVKCWDGYLKGKGESKKSFL